MIDEVIAQIRRNAESLRNRIVPNDRYYNMPWIDAANSQYLKCAEEHEQLANWLEELKALKENSISKEAFEKMKSIAYKKGHRQGYNKALDDFVKFANTMPTVETEGGEIRPMWLEEMAEKLKAGEQNEQSI